MIDTIRGSAAPMALACPGSIRAPGIEIDVEDEASAMGTAAHAVFDAIVLGLNPDVEAYAKKYEVNEGELAMLARFARIAWNDLREEFPVPKTELALACGLVDGVTLSGHLDLFSRIPAQRRAAVADLKTGRLDANYHGQVMAYCVLVFANDPEVDEVDASIIWLRDSEIERYHVTRADAAEWTERFITRVVEWDGVFHPGEHCAHCPRSHECPALLAMAQRDLAVFAGHDLASHIDRGLADMADEEIVSLRRRAKVIASVLESFDTVVRATVRKRGQLRSGDGQVLKFINSEQREVDALAAWPVLQGRLSDEEIAERVSVSLSRVEKLIAQKAGKGKGAGAVRELSRELEEAGAISTRVVSQLRMVREQEGKED